MALRRRGKEYRHYLRDNAEASVIPYSTWRRWLQQGKITQERLVQLGINPASRRQRRRVVPDGNHPRAHTTSPILLDRAMGNRHSLEPAPVLPSTSGIGVSHQSDQPDSNGELSSDDSSNHHENAPDNHESSDDESLSFNGNVNNQPASDMSDVESRNDADTECNDNVITSILESKNIGVDALNQPLADGLGVSKFETLLLIFHLAMRHGLTDLFVEDLMAFVNEIVGVPEAIPGSKYLFHRLFLFGSKPKMHFFCPPCNIYLGPVTCFTTQNVECEQCRSSHSVSSLNGGNYFITLSVKDQLKTLLARPNIKFVDRSKPSPRVLSDIYHGQIYQNLMRDEEPLANPNAFTLSISTDGSPVHNNGPNTLYPLHFYVNKIVPEHRFDVENNMLGGLWFSKIGEPNLQIFLKPIVDEILSLSQTGIVWRNPEGRAIESPIYVTCCCADSVARAKILNMMQFNGSYGCSYCLHPNTSFISMQSLHARSGIVAEQQLPENNSESECSDDANERTTLLRRRKLQRYLIGVNYDLRTNRELRKCMKLAARSNLQHIFGCKGLCVLCPLRTLNMVFGIPIDYMHAILLGVVKRLANLWFDRSNSTCMYYIGNRCDEVDDRLSKLATPSTMQKPRPMTDRVHWKAKEWRGFLLYFGLPCLLGRLRPNYYNHFKKLSTAIFILCKESINYEDAEEADSLLLSFVRDFQRLYGELNMVFNVHLVSHLARQVAKLGPLWAYSMFPFETANGRLVKLMKGTKGVATQIARKYMMTHRVSKLLMGNYIVKDYVIDFCSKIVEYNYTQNYTKCGDVTLLGRPAFVELNANQKLALEQQNVTVIPSVVDAFNRVSMNGAMYSSRQVGRQKAANDSCVRLRNGDFVLIDLIFPLNNDVWCVGTGINIALNVTGEMPAHIKQCSLDPFGDIVASPFQCVASKCIFVGVNDKNYVSEFANTFEKS